MIQNKKKTSFAEAAVLLVLLAVSIWVRFYDFDDPPLDFHPARQLHSALMARGFYLEDGGHLPGASAEYENQARMRGTQELWIEPPIMEKLTAWVYSFAGDADLRIPRAISIGFWLLGGWGMLLLGRKLISRTGAIVSFGFFLLYPYAVSASRSFQPDPLMVALIIWSLFAFCQWAEKPGLLRGLAAGLLTGAAILVKQVSIFPLAFAFLFYFLSVPDKKLLLRRIDFWLLLLLSVLPVVLYNIWGIFIDGFLAQQYQGRFFLSELISPAFYIRWIRQIDAVFGLAMFVLAVIGCLISADRRTRLLWLGYLFGYLVYGLLLPHHIGTHDYYQLPLFPLVAFGLGSLIQAVFAAINRIQEHVGFVRIAVTGMLILIAGWWTADSVMTLKRTDYRAWPERWKALAVQLDPYPGQVNTIGIMDDYGSGMIYWGLRTPMIWEQNIEKMEADQAASVIQQTMSNREYLIVTDLTSFYEQPRLQNWLNGHTSLLTEESDYLVYDLRELHD